MNRFTGESIQVLVGKDETPFAVQKSTLCATSAFFAAALKHDWKEAQEQTIRLPRESVEAFDIYLQWLFSRTVATKQDTEGKHHKEYMQLVQAYALGDMLQDTTFTNALIDCLIAKALTTKVYPSIKVVDYLYRYTPDTSPARRLMVDMYVWQAKGNGAWFGDRDGEFSNKDFTYDCLLAMSDKRKVPTNHAPYLTTEVSTYYKREKHDDVSDKSRKEDM